MILKQVKRVMILNVLPLIVNQSFPLVVSHIFKEHIVCTVGKRRKKLDYTILSRPEVPFNSFLKFQVLFYVTLLF